VARILLVEKDDFSADALAEALGRAGHDVATSVGSSRALDLLEKGSWDLLVAGIEGGTMSATELVEHSQEIEDAPPALVLSEDTSLEAAVTAMRAGALDYLVRPFHVNDVVEAAARALERGRARDTQPDDSALPRARDFDGLVGRNPRMQRVYDLVRTVSGAESAVLLTGESGTGKESVAHAIHRRSPRAEGPFVAVSCTAFVEGMLESELFGHEAGAFSGAQKERAGAFRRAEGGTLFLDEIGDLPLSTQVRLLRVIQQREVQPIGSDRGVAVDVRLVAATHHDLAELVREGKFREDLFFRLNVIPIQVPALRERPDDIPHLAQHFLERFAARSARSTRPPRGFTERAVTAMERYPWPGNVRELENAVERAVVLASEDVIDLHDLPTELRGSGGSIDGSYQLNTLRLSEVEEIVVRRVLTKTGWNIKRSAETLGITRATLYSKIRKYGMAVAR
jgi:two-component system response regulator HydG